MALGEKAGTKMAQNLCPLSTTIALVQASHFTQVPVSSRS